MANAAKQADETTEQTTDAPDGPLLDLSDAAVKRMIKTAKKRGYVTYDELNEVLPSEEVTSEQIEDTLAMLSDMGINVVETEEAEEGQSEESDGEEDGGGELVVQQTGKVAKSETKSEPTDRTDDPVRMYLREMGSVELLSREGEIAIAKRIEAGREAMIAGLCESPLTFQAIIIWRDELAEGKVLLRDIIDLEATYAGPDAKAPDATAAAAAGGEARSPSEDERRFRRRGRRRATTTTSSNMSLAAMEAELKPQVVETFDNIAENYKKLRKLQDQLVENRLKNQTLSPSQERRYKKLQEDVDRGGEERSRSTRTASIRWSSSSTTSTSG